MLYIAHHCSVKELVNIVLTSDGGKAPGDEHVTGPNLCSMRFFWLRVSCLPLPDANGVGCVFGVGLSAQLLWRKAKLQQHTCRSSWQNRNRSTF